MDLRKAMNGPAQLLGRGDFNLPSGQKDTWTNDISQGHRPKKKEDQAEVDGWQARKASMPGGYPDDRQRAYFDGLRRGAISALQKLAVAIGTQKFSSEYQAVRTIRGGFRVV